MSETVFPKAPDARWRQVQLPTTPCKLTGGAMYTSDMVLPGMLHAQVKKSPHAAGQDHRTSTLPG